MTELATTPTRGALSAENPDDPRRADMAAIECLKRVWGSSVTVELDRRFPSDGRPAYAVVTGLTVAGRDWQALTKDQARAGLEAMEPALAPAPRQELAKAVAMLSVRCKRRDGGQQEAELAVRLMIADLQELPGDVALWVLDRWSRTSPWWPTRAELLALADSAQQPRRFIESRLRMVLSRDADTHRARGAA